MESVCSVLESSRLLFPLGFAAPATEWPDGKLHSVHAPQIQAQAAGVYIVCGQQDYHSVVTDVILRHNTPVGVRLLCSKIYHLCYARMLQTLFDYALGVSLLCSCSKLNN